MFYFSRDMCIKMIVKKAVSNLKLPVLFPPSPKTSAIKTAVIILIILPIFLDKLSTLPILSI